MFPTDTGYLGIARKTVAVHDDVFVLLGADLPVVLRRISPGIYTFEGEAYVHGIMDGEILLHARRDVAVSTTLTSEEERQWLEDLRIADPHDLFFEVEELLVV